MEQKHRKAIQANFQSLVARTDLDSMVNTLYEKGVFSEQMIEPYRDHTVSNLDRKRRLYTDVTCRGPHAFGHLVETLVEQGHWDLARDLDPEHPIAFTSRPISSSSLLSREPKHTQAGDFLSLANKKNERNRTKAESQKNSAPPQPLPDKEPLAQSPELDNASADIPELKIEVVKSTSFIEDNGNNALQLYHTRGRNRGVLLIFSYVSFKNKIENDRPGADVDCAMLKNVFSEMGFKVLSYPDLTYQETVATLKSLDDVLANMECVFTVVSSHGYERRGSTDMDIRCSDGQLISFHDIMSYFDNRSLPRLIGIPKVFVFQVCRGSKQDYVWSNNPPPLGRPGGSVSVRDEVPDGAALPPHARPPPPLAPATHKIALYTDILIAHSTLPGFVSFRNHKLGSWYIQALCKVFAARAFDTHVDKLFTLVDEELQHKFEVQTSSIERWGFNKRLYLHPGLFE